MERRSDDEQRKLSDKRWVSSLASLLHTFGFSFQREPYVKGPTEGTPISAYRRNDGYAHALDVETEYWIIEFDPLAVEALASGGGFEGRTGLWGALRNLIHAASCGCGSCYDRVQADWERYQKLSLR